ncbi:MAG: hypothetical protein ACREK6_18515 [Candidatus Rokuibacteriota bacterium]
MSNILELTTTATRPVVKINDEPYELQHPDELSLLEQHYLRQWGKDIEEAFKGDEADPEAVSLAEKRVRDIVTMLMPGLPPDVLDTLSDTQCLAIMQAFTKLASATILASALTGGG